MASGSGTRSVAVYEKKATDPEDLVAVWDVHLTDGVHRIEFEHGTTTGKRVIRVDGREMLRRDWMFKLVRIMHCTSYLSIL